MDTPVNGDVARAISRLFASDKDSDCVIIFYRETNAPAETGAPAKRRRLKDGRSFRESLGAPLPGHLLVLRNASELFATQVNWMTENLSSQPAVAVQDDLPPACTTAAPGSRALPQLHVPLRSEEELPSARAAIAFAYTGQVQASGGIRRVLEVRQQGAYLQMHSCAAACDKNIINQLQASGDPQAGGAGGNNAAGSNPHGAGGSNTAHGARALADQLHPSAVLELYACKELWPDQQLQPSFVAVLDAAKTQLAAHFRDTLAVLNRAPLRAQLLALPAECLEALLDSSEFGTDSESSVLLLLATWVHANQPDEPTRARLCRLLRLVHLSRPYSHLVLPALAADHEASPAEDGSSTGWLPLSVIEAAYLCGLSTASEVERTILLRRAPFAPRADEPAWRTYSAVPRPQCIPPNGLHFTWHISQQVLLQALTDLRPGKPEVIHGTFEGNADGVSAWGVVWMAGIRITADQPAAGLSITCRLPSALVSPGSRLDAPTKSCGAVTASLRLGVVRWMQDVWTHTRSTSSPFLLDAHGGVDGALPLRQQAPGAGTGDDRVGGLLAPWAHYLHEGRITGSMTMCPLAAPVTHT